MEKAKAAVSDFMSKAGHHDTTVHERVQPAVTHQTVKPSKHENVTTAVDKEIHQDHYHTAVQPIQEREVLPEKHHHNLAGVEHRKFEHGDESEVQQRLKKEAAQFKDESIRQEEHHTRSTAPQVAGEHVHHHVHETIQPVVQKETIEPHVMHTTVPIHEIHHNAPQHHSTSALPPVSMDEFRRSGGTLTGRDERYDGFEGEPRNIGGSSSNISQGLGTGALRGDHSITGDHGRGTGTGASADIGSGLTGTGANVPGSTSSTTSRHGTTGEAAALGTSTVAGATSAAHHQHDKNRDSSGVSGTHFDRDSATNTRGTTTSHGTGLKGEAGMSPSSGMTGATGAGATAASAGSHRSGKHDSGVLGSGENTMGTSARKASSGSAANKPSLMDRLNPMKDADQDGKKGFMD
ncbi:Allergen protein [Lasiodiplodia theobromae]|uniref:Allergen protein n=1 Tax=Lasiodiplodia theobromae TaxID=45133 RepID=UPI0015C2E9DB|nr:Allergen protein [Lasiodiplodia theobromae]KAF4535840.1 Allergen protein [Lasiodiplodia theobromae]